MEREKEPFSIEYHADDYGLFLTQSQRILDCHQNGCLNGISIIANSPCLEQTMDLLRPFLKDIAIAVHLNLIEGKSLADKKNVGLLTDDQGVFKASFVNLLLRSFLPGRRVLRRQLKEEFRLQILAVKRYLEPGQALRLDGHAHYHMVPVAFDAMMDVIREENLDVSYIRIPREYPSLYLRHKECLQDFAPINLVKVAILNLLAVRNRWKYRDYLDKMERMIFMGVFLSGSMYLENVAPLMQDACALAKRLGCGLEVQAHPGGVYEQEDICRLTHPDDVRFLTSDQRRKEAGFFQMEEKIVCDMHGKF